MQYLIGFIVAMFIAVTGVGAGTVMSPLLIFFVGVPSATAVGTGLVFTAAIKMLLVPTQIARRQVAWRVLAYMLLGGLPGVIVGSLFLNGLASNGSNRLLNSILGVVLVLTAIYQIAFSFQPMQPDNMRPDRSKWLTLCMFPVGAEVGFSSAGAGALGTAALLSLTALAPAQIVGTDIVFGFVLSLAGSGAHLASLWDNELLLKHLVAGGIFGVFVGTYTARFIPKRPLRFGLWIWLLLIGTLFVYRNAF